MEVTGTEAVAELTHPSEVYVALWLAVADGEPGPSPAGGGAVTGQQ